MNTTMATPRKPHAGRRLALLALLLGIGATACQMFFGGPRGPYFPHDVHVEDTDCTTCHEGAEEQAAAGMPASEKGCDLCHEELDGDKPFEKTVAAFVKDGRPTWLDRKDSYAGEVRFDHAPHFEAELECEACHAPQSNVAGPSIALHGGKTLCMDCHANYEGGNDCAVCHKVLRADTAPPDHAFNWKRSHGRHCRRTIKGTGETTCAQCHTEDSCSDCHQREAPVSHSNFFRLRGHGLAAAIDRKSCTTCHQPDYCTSCHENTEPRSHRGSFSSPANTHCVSCHIGPTKQGCAVCHQTLPTHPLGEPLPGNPAHLAARSPIDCMTCHVGLKHANPGGDCRLCHK